jgi:hypothetical protein
MEQAARNCSACLFSEQTDGELGEQLIYHFSEEVEGALKVVQQATFHLAEQKRWLETVQQLAYPKNKGGTTMY